MTPDFLNPLPEEKSKSAGKRLTPIILGVLTVELILLGIVLYFLLVKNNSNPPGIVIVPLPVLFFVVIWLITVSDGTTKKTFWQTFAELNNASYIKSLTLRNESALMLNNNVNDRVDDVIDFNTSEGLIRIFSYAVQKQKDFKLWGTLAKSAEYLVFVFSFKGAVPHLYLNYLHDTYGLRMKEKLPLPAEFEKQFSITAPRKYEIEAMQIFTPELLQAILDLGVQTDIEIVDQKVFFYVENSISSKKNLDQKLKHLQDASENIQSLYQLLKPRLDAFSYTQIGNISSKLEV